MVAALFGKSSPEHPQLHVLRFGAFYANRALLRGKITRRSLDVEDDAPLGKESGDLARLYASNFLLIDRNAEDRSFAGHFELGQIIHRPVDHRPPDPFGRSRP